MEDIIHEIYTVGPSFKQVSTEQGSKAGGVGGHWSACTIAGIQLLVAIQAELSQGWVHQQALGP